MKKKIIKFVIQFVIILVMFGILWFMFKDSYKDILNQLKNVRMEIFFVAVMLGNTYYLIDSFIYKSFLKRENCKVNYLRCVAVAYMSVFFNVTTFGAGIKPAQVAYLNRKGVEPGKAFGILTVPYVFTKSTIVLYALVMLAINNAFVLDNFSDTFGYIYAGVGLSIVIIAVLILLCASEWFHRIICRLMDIILGRGKLAKYKLNDKITAGSCMIIYRLATYYIPFIISMLIMLVLEFDLRKVPEPE